MPFLPTGHTFRNDRFSFAMLDYRRVCMHTCGIPIISGMSGLGFLMEYVTSHHLHIPFGRASEHQQMLNSIRSLRLWTFEQNKLHMAIHDEIGTPKPTPKGQQNRPSKLRRFETFLPWRCEDFGIGSLTQTIRVKERSKIKFKVYKWTQQFLRYQWKTMYLDGQVVEPMGVENWMKYRTVSGARW